MQWNISLTDTSYVFCLNQLNERLADANAEKKIYRQIKLSFLVPRKGQNACWTCRWIIALRFCRSSFWTYPKTLQN